MKIADAGATRGEAPAPHAMQPLPCSHARMENLETLQEPKPPIKQKRYEYNYSTNQSSTPN